MPWFRVDDTFSHHAKVMAAGNAAIGLWVRAGAWSMQQLTDGFVPDHVVRGIGRPSEAQRLVEVGLWDKTDGGYRFHEWEGRQPSREKVEADRHAATERQRRGREAAKSRRESQRDSAVSHGPPDPTRPDPTRSSYGTTTDADASVSPDDRFAEFWDAYDHKVGRRKAEQKWRLALKKPGVTADILIAAAASYVAWVKSEGKHPQFTKHPATWLNGEHWRDERQQPLTNTQRHLALARQLAEEGQ